ncbi:MAG: hypothetical protein LBS72_06470 [Oscillospiraceae bacterium]|jgi:hypothetical protein|nr:hypothetical protein [Oscillospiraceae bacterium]
MYNPYCQGDKNTPAQPTNVACPGFPAPAPACNTAPQWPYNGGCSCCDECDTFNDDGGNGHYSDHPTRPCCSNGNCQGCISIAGDTPWMMPKAIGCGRTHKCSFPWKFALHEDELDNGDLPGRPPHTIMCVRATGTTSARVACEKMRNNVTSGLGNHDPLESYDLWLCLTIPVEIIIRDCSGFLYCLSSAFSQYVQIPLVAKVRNLKSAMVYIKVRVRLCSTVRVLGSSTNSEETIDHPPTWATVADDNLGEIGCNNKIYGLDEDGYPDPEFSTHALPEVKLDILLEACVVRLVPYGNLGQDPYQCHNTKKTTAPQYYTNP